MNKIFQNLSTIQIKSLTNKIVFFKRKEEKQQPIMYCRHVNPIYPPPGMDLKFPSNFLKIVFINNKDWTPEYFLNRIGGNCKEYGEKFDSLKQLFESRRVVNRLN